ncbi:MAG: hypothetical protein M0001_00360 [Treponema sp.]|nr:hypothetical protein [Treponema sp.]
MAEGLGNPWPWMLFATCFAGAGLGFFARALFRSRSRRGRSPVPPSILAMILLAAAVCAAAGLLIFPDKASLGDRLLLPSGLVATALGLASGLLPRTFGVGFLVALAAICAYAALCLEGWLPLKAVQRVATLTPFIVASSGSHGELQVDERDTVPLVQRVDILGTNAGLIVERLHLGGPLSVFGREHYRVAGIAVARGAVLSIETSFAPHVDPIDASLPLAQGPSAERSLLFASRWREASAPMPLVAFRTLSFILDPRAAKAAELRVVEK